MPPASDDDGRHGLRHAGDDAFQLTVDYLKQETVEPLRGLGRYLYMGILASFLVAIGLLMILIGILRLLQKETGTALTGDWSWVPYAVVVFLGLVVIAFAASRITAGPGRARMPEVEARQRADEAAAGEKAAAVTQPHETDGDEGDAGDAAGDTGSDPAGDTGRNGDTGGNGLMPGTTTRVGSNGRRIITREDLQAAYSQVMGEGEASARAAAPRGLAIAGAAAILVITLAFLAGRRRGRATSAVVEIRRL